MEKKTIFVISIFLVAVIGILFYLNRNPIESPQTGNDIPKIHQPLLQVGGQAPDILLRGVDGKPHQLRAYRGKVVLINFWASWCPPCLIEMPSLASVYLQLRDHGFEILAISLDESEKLAIQFVQSQKLPFKVLLDPAGLSAQLYLVYGLPYTVILDREGKIRHKIFGPNEWDRGKAFEKIKALL